MGQVLYAVYCRLISDEGNNPDNEAVLQAIRHFYAMCGAVHYGTSFPNLKSVVPIDKQYRKESSWLSPQISQFDDMLSLKTKMIK